MSFIEVIGPGTARGRLEKTYNLVAGPGGQVDKVLQVHSLRPHTLEGHMALYKNVLHHTGNMLPEWFLEAVGVQVSRLNACDYCNRHHTAGLLNLMKKAGMHFEGYNRALNEPEPGKPFSEREQAALAYVAKLTQAPASVKREDIDKLRIQGLSDGEILEINQVASYFAYANRTVSGLGVTTEGEVLGLSPQQGEGREAWRHD